MSETQRGDEEILSCCSSGVSTPVSISVDESCPKDSPPPPPPPRKEEKKDEKKIAAYVYPYHAPVRRSNDTTIQRVLSSLLSNNMARRADLMSVAAPTAVAIGPYHHHHHRASPQLTAMEDSKRTAKEEFCRRVAMASQSQSEVEVEVAVREKMLSLAGSARNCYAGDWAIDGMSDKSLADMMFLDGCFLLQFMVSMCPDDPNAPPEADPLMSRAEVHTCIDAIARDVMLFENQIPWAVLQELMDMRPGVPVDRFLALMATAFDVGNDDDKAAASLSSGSASGGESNNHGHGDDPPPPHLLGLFHRCQVGAARTKSHRVPRLSSHSTTAVELAEMGVKMTASKTSKFGDMSMEKRWRPLPWKLSLAPMVLNNLTACWLVNMAAYEACLSATQADNFAVSSYLCVLSCLVNREEDVKELRGKGIINSTFCDMGTLQFIKWTAPDLRVGHRYYEVFQTLHEYRQERWVWIAIHRFLYRNYKTIVAVLSIAGVLAGLFKTILSLKHHD